MNIIVLYYYIIDREQRNQLPLKDFSLKNVLFIIFPPFERALQNGYRITGTHSEGLFPVPLFTAYLNYHLSKLITQRSYS